MRYEIKGDTLPVVICHLEAGERMITERGSMAWMSPNMKMDLEKHLEECSLEKRCSRISIPHRAGMD